MWEGGRTSSPLIVAVHGSRCSFAKNTAKGMALPLLFLSFSVILRSGGYCRGQQFSCMQQSVHFMCPKGTLIQSVRPRSCRCPAKCLEIELPCALFTVRRAQARTSAVCCAPMTCFSGQKCFPSTATTRGCISGELPGGGLLGMECCGAAHLVCIPFPGGRTTHLTQ